MFKKYFTPSEAQKRLPLIKKIVGEILEKGKTLKGLVARQTGAELPQECFRLQEEIEDLMRELSDLGCFYKDWNFEIGLVDFPARMGEEVVFLCWRSDEKTIQWYHGMEAGYPGRKLISEDLL